MRQWDLHARLEAMRCPDALDGAGWRDGTSLNVVRELNGYRRNRFDWRVATARINAFDQIAVEIDGPDRSDIHRGPSHHQATPYC